VKYEIIVKSFRKCGITNAFDGTEHDVLLEDCDSSGNNNNNDECDNSDEDFWDSTTSRIFILHCHF
jgi:hypothetical protein